ITAISKSRACPGKARCCASSCRSNSRSNNRSRQEASMYRVLLVDDEPNILSALRRCLATIDVRQLDGDALSFETFTSPEAAIKRCDEQDFDLVISDYRMPSMNGVEFLARVMEFQPSAPRVIISGYADREVIIAAVNEVHLTR